LGFKLLLWVGLATVFFALAVCSWLHYSSFRKAVKHMRFKGIAITEEYEKEFDELLQKSEVGLQTRLLTNMIPLEIAGFVAAGIAASLEFL